MLPDEAEKPMARQDTITLTSVHDNRRPTVLDGPTALLDAEDSTFLDATARDRW
jgi:hypothetical protein